jgi:hypothetical protein
MKTGQRVRKWLGQFTAQASLVSVVALGLPGTAGAADVTVDCDGPGPADFGTINDALAALSLEGPNTIFVLPGLCVENVVIDNRERLTIDAPDGGLNIVPADPDQPVITIRDSRSIVLRTLSADNGNAVGYVITSSSGVRLEGNHSNSNGNGGYFVDDHSSVDFSSHTTTAYGGTGGTGLLVARGSFALVQAATLTGNAAHGIVCRDGSTCHLDGNVVIEDNGAYGLAAVNNSLIRMVSNTGPNSVHGNGSGISLAGNSRAVLTGPSGNSVTANNGPGIELDTNSSLALLNTTVSNNTGPGVSVLRNSVAGIVDGFGTNTISNNGGANLACDATSLLYGNLNGISKIACTRIERAMGPPRPGTVN